MRAKEALKKLGISYETFRTYVKEGLIRINDVEYDERSKGYVLTKDRWFDYNDEDIERLAKMSKKERREEIKRIREERWRKNLKEWKEQEERFKRGDFNCEVIY